MELGRWKRRGEGLVSKNKMMQYYSLLILIMCCSCLLLFSIRSVLFSSSCHGNACLAHKESRSTSTESHYQRILPGRRQLLLHVNAPGSFPPRCTSKCGHCTPCYPIHVSVPPVTAEYYPEAWRCKCGNNLYLP